LDEQQRRLQEQTSILQQQRRMAQYRFQEEYLEHLRDQERRLREERHIGHDRRDVVQRFLADLMLGPDSGTQLPGRSRSAMHDRYVIALARPIRARLASSPAPATYPPRGVPRSGSAIRFNPRRPSPVQNDCEQLDVVLYA
jgi:hypothetical protein